MPSTTIGVSATIDRALRCAFSDARLRLAPDAKLTEIIESLKAMGVECAVQDGFFAMMQQGTSLHTSLALRSFAEKHKQFFILEDSHDARTWSVTRKSEYLRDHSPEEFAQLLRNPQQGGVGVLSLDMTRQEYQNLSNAEKRAFVNEFGPGGVAKVMARYTPQKPKVIGQSFIVPLP